MFDKVKLWKKAVIKNSLNQRLQKCDFANSPHLPPFPATNTVISWCNNPTAIFSTASRKH